MDTTQRRTELDAIKIASQADLHRLWELLMDPLGFRGLSLWLTLIGPDRRPTRFLMEIGETPGVPTEDDVASLHQVLRQLLRDEADGTTAAFLITRPGRDGLTDDDRLFAGRLRAGARLAGVPLEPVHVATDRQVLAVAPDDLAA